MDGPSRKSGLSLTRQTGGGSDGPRAARISQAPPLFDDHVPV
jgi:hypothetical protein